MLAGISRFPISMECKLATLVENNKRTLGHELALIHRSLDSYLPQMCHRAKFTIFGTIAGNSAVFIEFLDKCPHYKAGYLIMGVLILN